ncbi:apolipoprotein C-IV-like [Hyperolius riggenbachi]|uniref:apolipoprotein C-IV-like n=1 Tax=Hyperolius riggenbachi TaxID=752182 RepID=UPI0035A31796
MQMTSCVWNVALLCLLACSVHHVSGYVKEDGEEAPRNFFTSAMDSYVKPYTEPLVERVTNSTAWNFLGDVVNRVQGTASLAGQFFYTYYEDHFKESTEKAKQWIQDTKESVVERISERFQNKEQ